MTQEAETLTQLVADHVGVGRGLTYRKFEERAVDPMTGYRPSRGVLWKIAHGKTIQVEPELIRAVAEGLELPPLRVKAAAALQYLGLRSSSVGGGIVLHDVDVDADTLATRLEVQRQQDRSGEKGE